MTLAKLGTDPAQVSVELAAVLSRRAKIEGGSLSLDPRARQLFERAEEEAKRLQDEYVSTEHLLLAAAEIARRSPAHPRGGRRQSRSHPQRPSVCPRRTASRQPKPREHLPGTREVRARPDREPPERASWTRSSAATRRSAASSRSCRAGPRTTRPDRRAGRRQDCHRRGPGPAHRARRCAGRHSRTSVSWHSTSAR